MYSTTKKCFLNSVLCTFSNRAFVVDLAQYLGVTQSLQESLTSLCLPTYEPLFEWNKVNKSICSVFVSSRLFLPCCLWWQLSSMMTEAALSPPHWVLFLWWPWWRQWLRLSSRWCPPNTFGRFTQAVLQHSCHTFCYVAFADQYFIFVYPLSAAITHPTVLEGGRLFVRRLGYFLIKGFVTLTLI